MLTEILPGFGTAMITLTDLERPILKKGQEYLFYLDFFQLANN